MCIKGPKGVSAIVHFLDISQTLCLLVVLFFEKQAGIAGQRGQEEDLTKLGKALHSLAVVLETGAKKMRLACF